MSTVIDISSNICEYEILCEFLFFKDTSKAVNSYKF